MNIKPTRALVVATILLLAPIWAQAQFSKQADIPISTSNNHGIAFDGSQWHIAAIINTPSFNTFDSAFTFQNSVTVAGAISIRGLTYDPNSGNLFLGSNANSTVYEVTTSGTELNSFVAGSGNINALAYDPRDDTIWLARFTGEIEQYARNGGLIDSFSTGPDLDWTGMALDLCTGNLFLLENGDQVYEYQTDGTQIGLVIPTDQIIGNGQGLYYDASTAQLWATSQNDDAALFQDSTRQVCSTIATEPVPSTGRLAIWVLSVLILLIGSRALGTFFRQVN